MTHLSDIYSLPYEICDIIESQSLTVTLSMGESLTNESDLTNNIYFLLSGRLRHTANNFKKNQSPFTLNIYSPPYIAGLTSYLSGQYIEYLTAGDSTLLS